MRDFTLIIVMFIMIGVSTSLIFINHKKRKNTYCSEGMSISMCLWLAISTVFKFDMGLGLCIGMLMGEIIGMLAEKK